MTWISVGCEMGKGSVHVTGEISAGVRHLSSPQYGVNLCLHAHAGRPS